MVVIESTLITHDSFLLSSELCWAISITTIMLQTLYCCQVKCPALIS